ncbi:MAG: formylglycine-generating enzyme family protein [Nitrospinaceae bacterium]
MGRAPFHPAGVVLFLILSFLFFPSPGSPQPTPPPGMVYIPQGYFPMGGSSGREDEKPLHFVYTSAYFIDKYEVSNAEYMEFVQATGHEKPKFWQDENFNKPDYPVVGISWFDALAYAHWKGKRLPTEAEWEKAARGNDRRLWPWGGKWDKGFFFYFLNIFGDADNFPYTAPVNYYQSGMSPFGLFNTSGNVWEWCLDWYDKDYYRISPEIDPEGPAGPLKMKVLRGGSWINGLDGVQVVRRARNLPSIKNQIYGFRTVLPVP